MILVIILFEWIYLLLQLLWADFFTETQETRCSCRELDNGRRSSGSSLAGLAPSQDYKKRCPYRWISTQTTARGNLWSVCISACNLLKHDCIHAWYTNLPNRFYLTFQHSLNDLRTWHLTSYQETEFFTTTIARGEILKCVCPARGFGLQTWLQSEMNTLPWQYHCHFIQITLA